LQNPGHSRQQRPGPWIPGDVTAAEGGDSSYNAIPEQLQQYKTYFFGSLDLPLVPDAGNAMIPPTGWVQQPKIVCDTCPDNPMVLSFTYSKVTVTKE
jgi:hypothetical protein